MKRFLKRVTAVAVAGAIAFTTLATGALAADILNLRYSKMAPQSSNFTSGRVDLTARYGKYSAYNWTGNDWHFYAKCTSTVGLNVYVSFDLFASGQKRSSGYLTSNQLFGLYNVSSKPTAPHMICTLIYDDSLYNAQATIKNYEVC